ncbi:exonuclease 1-like isoform X1 [Octopus vulgaris]|uniref:Exonuclease 1-like isoform X1 n=1 Tax=Octopus vulgaris TaxID=6645 RepID=A0AA36B8F1_OCTVU|nr:exonuclease 1-like isoform X1 [Octopus vulgaris]
MGITGLLPFLKKIHVPTNISQFQGATVAVDVYCWLHKGAFSCAEKLAFGEDTDQCQNIHISFSFGHISHRVSFNLICDKIYIDPRLKDFSRSFKSADSLLGPPRFHVSF